MVATLHNLADMRSRRRIPTSTAATSFLHLMGDGLAAAMTVQSFFIQYVVALHRFHASVLSAGYSPSLRKPSSEDRPFR